jgi:hypothetical protein
MSGQPDIQTVRRLRFLATERSRLENEIRIAEGQIREASLRLKKCQEDYVVTKREMLKLLEDMDCASRGNGGWENRITLLLSQLVEEAK